MLSQYEALSLGLQIEMAKLLASLPVLIAAAATGNHDTLANALETHGKRNLLDALVESATRAVSATTFTAESRVADLISSQQPDGLKYSLVLTHRPGS